MTVFKYYLTIVKKNIWVVAMYFIIFSLIAIITGMQMTKTTDFKEERPKIYLKDNDQSNLSRAFISYIKTKTEIIELEEEKIKDALFNQAIDYAITIPQGFADKFLNTEEVKVESEFFPNSFSSKYIEMNLNQYLKHYKIYLQNKIEPEKINSLVENDLKKMGAVNLLVKPKEKSENIRMYYNMMNYTIMGTCLYIIGLITSKFMERKVKRRNLISSTSMVKTNRQLFLGHVTVTIVVWLYYVILSILLYKETMLSVYGLLLMLNSLIFCFMILSLAFLLGTLIKKSETRGGIINVIALGTSFLCGAFVPRELLPETLQTYTQILPSHWYIINNENILSLGNISFNSLSHIIYPMFILIIFTFLFFLITNLVTRAKAKEE